MRILVQKFGGTSVANLECMKQVREKALAARAKGYKVVVVLSARSGDTNKLLALADEYSHDPDSAEVDSLVSTGEQVSVALFAMMLKDAGISARSLLGFQIPMKTDSAHGKARITGIDNEKMMAMLQEYDVLAVAGFQGITDEYRISTLGRGGSDTSAVAIAAALGCECEIYTDVDGVMVESSCVTNVPGVSVKVERTCTGTLYFLATSTERICSTLAPMLAISSISS